MRAPTVHEYTIRRLMTAYPEAQRLRFGRALRAFQQVNGVHKEEQWKGGIIPDLWWIDNDCMSAISIEVEDSNAISGAKLEKYQWLWRHLDCDYLEFHLIASDRWGNLTPIPLGLVSERGEGAKNATMLELTEIYCVKDARERAAKRKAWMRANPNFVRARFHAIERFRTRCAMHNVDSEAVRHRLGF